MAAAAVAQSTAAMEALADFLVVDMEAPGLEAFPVVGQAPEDPAMEAVEDQAMVAPVLEALEASPAVAMEAPALEVVPADGQALEDPAMEAVEDQATEASAMVALGAFQLVQVEAMAAQATAPEDGHHPAMEVAAEDLEDQAMEAPVVAPATAVLLALEAAQGDGPALEYPAMEAVAAAVIEAVEDVEGMDAAAAEVVVTAGLHSRCRVTEEGPVEAPAAVTGTPGSLLQ